VLTDPDRDIRRGQAEYAQAFADFFPRDGRGGAKPTPS